ncbi:DEAD-box ATP-dependent RNA helicase DeaD (= CshA) [hydrothermal vent metagenome]|uniref:DEAD-box ATP-dependent RNA helicase DeaD (= CshA) n=1 Tax=hydrothermal vent metagenome TaxID=652676 RepID=A0A3B0QXL1_9ZZZZ
MKFNTLDLNEKMLQGIEDAGFEKCTPVQEQALPESIAGKDIIVQSQTGTGKTAVFITTIYNNLIEGGKERPKGARALVMAPTRELAVQIDTEAKKLAAHLPFRSIAIYGGVEYEKQISALKEGVDLVVATPGRMIDLYKSKSLSLNDIEIFVVDEADRMFDMGFAPDISYIASRLPKGKERQTMLFSATIDENVHRLAARYMKPEPVVVEIEPEQVTVDKIDQKVLYPSNKEKLVMLMALLRRPDVERAIIFANMKRTVEMLEWKLSQNGFLAMGLTGDVSQSKRQRIIDDMKAGKLKILVATDVVARGLHVEDITHVYNYDLPQEAASYVHRIGRTARAGKSGKAYSLVCEDHAFNLPEIEKYIERKIPAEWIDEAEMLEDKAGPYRSRSPRSGSKGPAGKGGQGRGQRTTGSGRGGSQKTSGARGGRKPGAPASSSANSKAGDSARGSKSTASSSKPAQSKQEHSKQEKTSQDNTKAGSGEGQTPVESKGTEDTGRPKRPRRSRGRGRGVRADNDKSGSDNKEKAQGIEADGGNGEAKSEAGVVGVRKSGRPARRNRGRGPRGASQEGRSSSGTSGATSASASTTKAPSRGSRGGAKAKQGTRSRTARAGTGRPGSASETSSIGNALIESQTGGTAAVSESAPSSGAPGVKPKKGVLKRILNVFGRK